MRARSREERKLAPNPPTWGGRRPWRPRRRGRSARSAGTPSRTPAPPAGAPRARPPAGCRRGHLVVEQEVLDSAFLAAVVRVDADGRGRPHAERLAGVDTERRYEEIRRNGQVGRREAERPPSRVSGDDGPFYLHGSAEQFRGPVDLSGAGELPDPAGRHALDERYGPGVEAELGEQREVAGPPAAEAEVRAGNHDPRAHRLEHVAGELLRSLE